MSLNDLAPTNTKRARENVARIFLKFEEVEWKYLEACMKRENAALVLEAVVDKFGMHLAFKEGRRGKLLARHSVMQYFRQAKNWLLGQFPQHRTAVDKSLLKKGQVLERHCMKRESCKVKAALRPQNSRSQAHNRKTYYLTDWEPTWEPRENLNQTVIAKFNKERRRLVRNTYIEYEAVEDKTLNKTEG